MILKHASKAADDAILSLRHMVERGSTVYVVDRGRSRADNLHVALYRLANNIPLSITYQVAQALNLPYDELRSRISVPKERASSFGGDLAFVLFQDRSALRVEWLD